MKMLVAVLAGLFVTAGATAAAGKLRVIAHAAATGPLARVTAAGSASDPHVAFIRVTTRPAQDVKVAWTTTCKRFGTMVRANGTFTATGQATRSLKLALPSSSCTAQASATIRRKGLMQLTLLAR
jgi:hypothetical protein